MAGLPRRAQAGLTLVFTAILFATFLAPISAQADTDLVIGGQARIAYANGDDVRLREDPSSSGTLIKYIPEGTVVDVVVGPAEDDEGNLWFQVEFDGDTGYVISDYLALLQGADEVSANSVAGVDAGDVIGTGLIANTSGDGVRCRSSAGSGGAVITVVPEGEWVELTGAADGGWQPINCGGQGGFVSERYVSYDGTGTDNVGDGDGSGAEAPAEEAEAVGAQSVTGAAMVSGTNGDGVNCRSSASSSGNVITILSEGSNVSLRGDARGDWQPVVCAGSNGFVSSQFLDFDDSGSDDGGSDSGGGDATGEAVVDGTNGDGVNCRTRASANSSVIVILPEGADVTLRGGASGGWQPVFCGGSSGFVSSQYLSTGGGGGGDDDEGDGGGSSDVTGEATVTGTGNGLRCRTRANFDSSVITVLFDGDGVSLRGNVSGDWQPVVCAGSNGFVFADYLDYDGNGGGDDGGSDDGAGPFSVGATVVVDGTNGDGVRLRSSASSNGSIVMVVAEGQTATVISGSTSSWVAVTYKSTSGFISATYLAASTGGSSTDDGDDDGGDDGGSSGGLSSGDNAVTTSDLNLRYDPRMSAGVAAVAPSGTVVRITGGSSNNFYAVDWDGLSGYMSADYLQFTERALSERGGSGDDDVDIVDEPGEPTDEGGDGDGGGGSSSGSAIVDYAMQYVGYPYVWATRGPSSFDCSGFTYWVVLNTLGINISPGTTAQINYGTPISRGSIQPGDLVFFQNTYTWGLSHVGIYIGGGKFVHAENESTGVVVSDLGSSYYSSRWYGARRVG